MMPTIALFAVATAGSLVRPPVLALGQRPKTVAPVCTAAATTRATPPRFRLTHLLEPARQVSAVIADTTKGDPPTLTAIASEHYLALAGTQMMLVRGLSDIIAQFVDAYHEVPLGYWATISAICSSQHCISPLDQIDFGHVAVMAVVGFLTSGVGGALWWRHLERHFGPSAPSLHKVAADYTFWAPTVIAANLVFVPVLCGRDVITAVENMQANLPGMLQWEFLLFVPFNIVLFTRSDLVPPEMRPSYKACLSLVFSTVLSLSCAAG